VSSYRPSIVTFPLSLRVSERLPLLCSSTPLFHSPPPVSPKFPYVSLGVGGWPLSYEEQGVGLIVRAISFPDFQSVWSWLVLLIHQRRRKTVDGQTTYNLNTALCTIVHRAVKILLSSVAAEFNAHVTFSWFLLYCDAFMLLIKLINWIDTGTLILIRFSLVKIKDFVSCRLRNHFGSSST